MNHPDPEVFASRFAQPTGPAALFEHYGPHASMFVSPGQTLLAHGVAAVLPEGPAITLAARAAAFMDAATQAGHPGMLIGAIPFLPGARPHLFVPQHFEIAGGARLQQAASAAPPPRRVSGRSQPSGERYQANVAEALRCIGTGRFEKVVLSRSLRIEGAPDMPRLLRVLAGRNPNGYTYAIPVPDEAGDCHETSLVGASPELLLARRGGRVLSNPLAGSIPRSADAAEDERRARGLLESAKDLHEHALVADAVAAALQPFCRWLDVPGRPSLVATPTMWHLSSRIEGELADSATSSLELALALHPTPAVCGYPRDEARAFILQNEGFERGFFTGLVGWCNQAGDGEWAVTIRCAAVDAASATLYAGAGIVAGSDPALELAETGAKLATMLGAMGLELAAEEDQ